MEAIEIKNFWYSVKSFFSKMTPMKTILLGFVTLIFIGAGLLCLPISSRSGNPTDFLTSYFTATSAVCVTGLIKVDTHNYWSLFGQGIIITLIQIGGMGFMTVCVSVLSAARKRIGLTSRSIMQNSIAAPQLGGIVRMTRFVLLGTMFVELFGAIMLSFAFVPRFGFLKGIWFSVFHSISAFCNAGFDLMGGGGDFSSLTAYAADWYVCIVIGVLVTVGGLGFFVWSDLIENKHHISRYKLQTKIVLLVSAVLTFGGAILIFLLELKNPAFLAKPVSQQINEALFQSMTCRTAGFNTADLANLTHPSILVMILMMLVGGSSGSTAGGMKTTTVGVLFLSIASTFRQKKNIEVFGRRLEDGIATLALTILALYLALGVSVGVFISVVDDVPLISAMFESCSAVATVGLTTGITSGLCGVSSVLLTLLMIFGRVGSITVLLAFANPKNRPQSTKPLEKIQIG